mgnify:CR=1 FL=1
MASPDFWKRDQDYVSEITQERSDLNDKIDQWEKNEQELKDIKVLLEIADEEGDRDSIVEIVKDIKALEDKINHLYIKSLLGNEDDKKNAIVHINAGAGGTEAQDWAEMLFRMYSRWCERRGYEIEIMDLQEGEEAGIKSVTFLVKGNYAYGYLKSENGIHRMVRISPFDATRRRHTSFAAVSVFPEVDTHIEINIDERDIRIDTFRASGPGGQHVNKTSSAVRITHIPTGIVVQCQNEKSQHRNKEMAFKVLKARLYELEKKKQEQKKQEIHKSQKEIAWGSQIRSYIFNPYRLVKDHRTSVEVGNLENVMDGDIDIFINGYLRSNKTGSLAS